eukprot:GHVQ01015119.1.p1 GENE.GHVQ01015119.1~~GHVQ01015119.1.p1  ORF type:complete len:355 (+),score=56.15 GHVQ01015119.1:27-1091(+)
MLIGIIKFCKVSNQQNITSLVCVSAFTYTILSALLSVSLILPCPRAPPPPPAFCHRDHMKEGQGAGGKGRRQGGAGGGDIEIVVVGVLALQGAFADHEAAIRRLNRPNVVVKQIRLPQEVPQCTGMILPGGESTAMRIIGRNPLSRNSVKEGEQQEEDIITALRQFILRDKKPVWGTCAGCILLANDVMEGREGLGRIDDTTTSSMSCSSSSGTLPDSIGGLDVTVSRNYFGRQRNSFEGSLVNRGRFIGIADNVPAICIRAPAILRVHSPEVEVLAEIPVPGNTSGERVMAGLLIKPVAIIVCHFLVLCSPPLLSIDTCLGVDSLFWYLVMRGIVDVSRSVGLDLSMCSVLFE